MKCLAACVFVVLGGSLWAQHPNTNQTKEATINHVKSLQVWSLDRNLPKVTLEFFLKYEGEGAPIKWSVNNCDQLSGNPATDHERDAGICVEAEVDLKDNRSATVVVSLGKPGTRPVTVPSVFSVTVTNQNGSTHEVPRLGDLPMELHRPLPKRAQRLASSGSRGVITAHRATDPSAYS